MHIAVRSTAYAGVQLVQPQQKEEQGCECTLVLLFGGPEGN